MDSVLRTLLVFAVTAAMACGPRIDKKPDNNSRNADPNAKTNNVTPTNGATNAGTNSGTNAETNQKTNNQTGNPCIDASNRVAFGTVTVGDSELLEMTVTNCSTDADLELTGTSVQGPFSLTLPAEPTIAPGASASVPVRFTPPGALDYNTTATLSSNAGDVEIELSGTGSATMLDCATARIEAAPSGDPFNATDQLVVNTSTTVSLSGLSSTSPNGEVTGYTWSLVSRPGSSTARLSPNGAAAEPSLLIDAVGTYEVELDVTDSAGEDACNPDRLVITATDSDETTVHVQLTWDTPADDDQTDQTGTDLDLHYMHPNGTWDEEPWDCFWRNLNPDWGPAGAPGNPNVDIDDTNGAGPENISHPGPEDVVYRVGVYYYADNGFGASYATVKVYIDNQLILESQDVELSTTGKFWYGITVEPAAMDAADTRQIVDGYP